MKIDHKLIPSYKCDIIVPIYNTSDELLTRCLSSIAMQVNLKDLHVIIVDDCSDKVDSSNIVNSFKNVMDIDYIKLEENVGAGKARNIGYERGKNEYVLFCDSDDSYFSAFSIEKLLIPFKENRDTLLTMCAFLEQLEGINFKRHQYNLTWIFSKIYRRSFLDKWNIRFPESGANEDVAFNLLVWACINDINKIKYCDDIVYMWHNNQESITRSADGEYKKTGMVDFVKSYIWTIREKIKRNINDTDFSKQQNMNCIMMLYWYYVMMSNTANDSLMKKYNNMCYEFYCYIISNLTEFVNADNFKQSYLQSIHKCGDIASHYVPLKSIYDWLFTFEQYRKNKERR